MRAKGLLGAGWIPTEKGAEGQHKQPSAAASSTLVILCLPVFGQLETGERTHLPSSTRCVKPDAYFFILKQEITSTAPP